MENYNKRNGMLIIKRMPGQGVQIGPDVWVYASLDQSRAGNGIMIAIVADGKKVMREELLVKEGSEPGPLYDSRHYRSKDSEPI